MTTITIERSVTVDPKYQDVQGAVDCIKNGGRQDQSFAYWSYVSNSLLSDHIKDGETLIGTSTITITLLPDDQINGAQIESLKELRKSILAEAQKKVSAIEDKISKLTAIGYEGETNEI